MFYKFSYLSSVSVLACAVMGSTVQAMDDSEPKPVKAISVQQQPDALVKQITQHKLNANGYKGPNDLLLVIDTFHNGPATPVTHPENNAIPEETSTAWAVLGSLYSGVKTCASPVAYVIGNGSRTLGDVVRGDSAVGDLLVEKGLEYAKGQTVNGVAAAPILNEAATKAGLMQQGRNVTGNILRTFGKLCVGETPTLSRAIRLFWVDSQFTLDKIFNPPLWVTPSKFAENPEYVFTTTVCGLFLSPYMQTGDQIRLTYHDFINSWNNSSQTTHLEDAGLIQEYFVNGIIKGSVLKGVAIDERFLNYILALNVDLAKLPATKEITDESVTKEAVELKKALLADQVKNEVTKKRKEEFLKYAKDFSSFEKQKLDADLYRLNVVNEAPIPTPSPVQVIETQPNQLVNELGQSLIEGPQPNETVVTPNLKGETDMNEVD